MVYHVCLSESFEDFLLHMRFVRCSCLFVVWFVLLVSFFVFAWIRFACGIALRIHPAVKKLTVHRRPYVYLRLPRKELLPGDADAEVSQLRRFTWGTAPHPLQTYAPAPHHRVLPPTRRCPGPQDQGRPTNASTSGPGSAHWPAARGGIFQFWP